jgi:mannose-6-phosphate isomerase-like protein (cupin superfamily)
MLRVAGTLDPRSHTGSPQVKETTGPTGSEQQRPAYWGRGAYELFLDQEGIPVHRGYGVDDLRTVDVAPWPRLDAKGAYIRLFGAEDTDGSYLLALDPGRSTAPEKHLFEEYFFVLSGRGTCEVWNEGEEHVSFEWQEGSLFSVPLNMQHRIHNGSGTLAARLLAVTTMPIMMNLLHNSEFIFGCPYVFRDRYDGRADYFDGSGTLWTGRVWETNFVADVRRFQLKDWKERGAGGKNIRFEFANNTMVSHVSEFPVGTYKKGHRHGPGYHVVMLSGSGYSWMWPDTLENNVEIHWKPGALFVPPGQWWHQHFNTGSDPARYLAIRWGGNKWKLTAYLDNQDVDKDTSQGGNQIGYEDQDPRVHRTYLERCKASGVPVKMDEFRVRV